MILNNKKSYFALTILTGLFVALSLNSCRKDDFDEPPIYGSDPNLTVNMTIDSLKRMYYDTIINKFANITINKDWIIAGTVVGDDRTGNIYKNIVLEDATGGIAVRIDITNYYVTYPVGRRVFVKLNGLVLGAYKNLFQIGGYIDNTSSPASAAPIPSSIVGKCIFAGVWGLNPTPSVVPLSELASTSMSLGSPLYKWQNRLVQVNDVEFLPGDTSQPLANAATLQSLSRYFAVCGNSSPKLAMYTSGYSTIATEKTPNKNGSIVGVFSLYNTGQFIIRDVDDFSLMTNNYCGDGPGPGVISEGFNNITVGSNIGLPGWSNIAVQGNKYWLGKSFTPELFAEATAFSSGLPAMEAWLITPGFPLGTSAGQGDTLSFKSELAYWKSNGLTVWISTDYTGVAANFASATWTQLSPTLPGSSTGNYNWVNSGDVSLSSFTGTGYIGFKYLGDGTTNTTTFRIDNVRVR